MVLFEFFLIPTLLFLFVTAAFVLLLVMSLGVAGGEAKALHSLALTHPGAVEVPKSREPMYKTTHEFGSLSFYWGGGIKLNHGGYRTSLYHRKVKAVATTNGHSTSYTSVWAISVELHRPQSSYASLRKVGLIRSGMFYRVAEGEARPDPWGYGRATGDELALQTLGTSPALHHLMEKGDAQIEVLPSSTGSTLLYSFFRTMDKIDEAEWQDRLRSAVEVARVLDGGQ